MFASYMKYIVKMFLPRRLAVFYPFPLQEELLFQAIISAIALVVISVLVIRLSRRYKYLLTGWLMFLGTLVPVIGLVQVGDQALADRYSYIPLTGLFIIVAWGSCDLLARWRRRNLVLSVSAILVLVAMSVCSYIQSRYWRNSISLFEHTLSVTKYNFVAHNNLAQAYHIQGNVNKAIEHTRKALQIAPDFASAHHGLGIALLQSGDLTGAIMHLEKAVKLKPDYAIAHYNLATAYEEVGNFELAISHYTSALRNRADYFNALHGLGAVFLQQGQFAQAITYCNQALPYLSPPHSIF